ncbi:unnamed protein product [marine sediment metagenome]|uniref:Uncharacterized protein n=1 Tax=marine sediment metagenome TaxID=412755 RepID=X1B5E2_9ZZZZ
MKETPFTRAVDEVVELKLKAVDAYIEEVIEPLSDVGNPEKLIGKKYEDWTPVDRQLLIRVYGTNEPNPLSNLIFRKEYEKVLELEGEV